ncbi:MAG: aminopeptidase [Candidatus Izemoplasmatales bacterium]
MKTELLRKYAELTVKIGANVQKNQSVVVRATTETKELVRLIVEEAYLAGAKYVYVQWSDDFVSRLSAIHQTVETLENIPDWVVKQTEYFMEEGAAFISITSPIPGLNKDVDPVKMQKAAIASQKKLGFFQTYLMGSGSQWTIVAYPNKYWAKKVFPDLDESAAVETLWDAILNASRVRSDNDPVEEWNQHNTTLLAHNKILNDLEFESLHFTNRLGTDVVVKLVDEHIWAGGGEVSEKGTYFNPNIPTEETFTMPSKFGTSGKVVATKPLNYQGKLIENFYVEFENGKVVRYGAEKEVEALKSLIEFDEGSAYIGEIALISHNSPISNSNILFYNTLFDENASCHMALGRAYTMNIKNGTKTPIEELIKKGYNNSMTHVDFMFGSSDMSVVGTRKNGEKVVVFEKGNFVI